MVVSQLLFWSRGRHFNTSRSFPEDLLQDISVHTRINGTKFLSNFSQYKCKSFCLDSFQETVQELGKRDRHPQIFQKEIEPKEHDCRCETL